jgi:trimeric autotransporter adhesin
MAFALLVSAPISVSAQSAQGGLRGTVKDAQSPIPGVTVTMVNEANGVTRDTATNGVGEYSFPAIEPGTYTVRVALQGFKTFERKGVIINTQTFVGLDVTLEIGALEENITVTGQSPLIETTNASTGGVIDSQALETIPSPGRSVYLMANLEPTVQTSQNAHWNRMQDQIGNSAVSMGGGGVRSNNFLIDGFPVTDLSNRASTNPSMEAVQEMKVQLHTYDAEMGRTGGGVMNMAAKSGANQFHGSGYTVLRPTNLVQQLLIPKLTGQPNLAEYWRNGGGGGGGPIVKNKTFFWFAGEKYVDKQPQASQIVLPTNAERLGDFSALTRNGVPFYIKDPLSTGACSSTTGGPGCFAGNIIPAQRISPVGQKLLNYMQTPDSQVDNGSPNFSMLDSVPSRAYQWSAKIDHHFNNSVALNGFVLRQVTHEANTNYNRTNDFVGASYQLDRVIKTYVVNNTYVINSSTVLTLRGGYNHFDDNYNLNDRTGNLLNFNVSQLGWPTALTNQMSDTQRFPSLTLTGYRGTGWTSRQANGFYQSGANGTLSHLMGTHSFKVGGDYRQIGVKSLNYGASTGTFTFTGTYSGNAVADLLLGYPQSGNVPLSKQVDGFVNYYSGYVQDDWRVSDKLTLNYGLRLERETGLGERDNQITVNFDQTAVSPLNSQVHFTDPLTGQARTLMGGLVFAGQNGAPTVQGNQPKVNPAPRVGAVYSFNDKNVVRGGYGLFYSPWNYPSAGTTNWGQIGYSSTTNLSQAVGVPTTTIDNPFPSGLIQPSGNNLGLATGAGSDVFFIDPNKGASKAQQYSVDYQRELPKGLSVSIGYTGLTGSNLSWGGTTDTSININQIDPKYQYLTQAQVSALVPNPFYGVAAAGSLASRQTIEVGQLLRPFPQFLNVNMNQSTGARSQYNAAIFQLRKRATGIWGGDFSYTYSRLNDNQFGQSNYYSSSPGLLNNYEVVRGSSYYNPDAEYGRSLLDSPHKIVIRPLFNLPFGEGKPFLSSSRLGNALLGGWVIAPVIQIQSGFPIGVSQNVTGTPFLYGGTARPNIVPGVPFLVAGDITDRIRANPNAANLYLNPAAFSASALNTFGNAPRILPGVLSPRRNNVDLSVAKNIQTPGSTTLSLRLEVINMLNLVQWAAPTSAAFGNSSFGQITNQANNARLVQFTIRYGF